MRNILLATLIAAPTLAFAGPAEDTVAARQGYYKLLGANMAVFAGMAKGDIEYDAAVAQTAADNMVTLTKYNLTHLYAPGTSSDDVKGARALPKIWSDFPGVQAKGADFVAAVNDMDAAAGQGKDAMVAALGKLGGTCKGCHTTYRAD